MLRRHLGDLLTQMNFSISAAVGFISIFGVGVMNGLLLVSSFHRLRLDGVPMEEAILQGAAQRLRPMMMTTLTAIFGLVPAALLPASERRANVPWLSW